MKERTPLPSYKKPPVTEVVVGVQFNELVNFSSIHYGLYHQRVLEKYPLFQELAPIDSTFEFFGEDDKVFQASPKTTFYQTPPLRRGWFLEKEQNRLIQLEPEHFFHNWRKVTGQEGYPRYESIKDEFKNLWNDFLDFSKEQNFNEIKVNQWEVTYVNHIDIHEGWETLGDMKNIFSQWSGDTTEGFLPIPEFVEMKERYAFPEQKGRLHISLNRAIRQRDNKECFLFRLTARGRLETSKTDDILDCLDRGREWIVKGFTDLTTTNAHNLWKREN